MNQTLKELLKPPFKWFEKELVLTNAENECLMVLCSDRLVGIPINKKLLTKKELEKARHLFSNFLIAALNEKYEKDFAEPMRWIKDVGYHYCPKCKRVLNFERYPKSYFNYCPSCGQKLDPPEGE